MTDKYRRSHNLHCASTLAERTKKWIIFMQTSACCRSRRVVRSLSTWQSLAVESLWRGTQCWPSLHAGQSAQHCWRWLARRCEAGARHVTRCCVRRSRRCTCTSRTGLTSHRSAVESPAGPVSARRHGDASRRSALDFRRPGTSTWRHRLRQQPDSEAQWQTSVHLHHHYHNYHHRCRHLGESVHIEAKNWKLLSLDHCLFNSYWEIWHSYTRILMLSKPHLMQ